MIANSTKPKQIAKQTCFGLSKLYVVSFWAAFIYAILLLCIEFYLSSATRYENLRNAIVILMQSGVFFCWAKIYRLAGELVLRQEGFDPRRLIRISYFLLISFGIDLIDNIAWVAQWPSSAEVNWDQVMWPVFPQNPVHYVSELSGVFFKFIHFWKPFLLPGVHGSGALILAVILYCYALMLERNPIGSG